MTTVSGDGGGLRSGTFATIVDVLALGTGEHRHGVAAEVLVEGTVYAGGSTHSGEGAQEGWGVVVLIVKAAELESTTRGRGGGHSPFWMQSNGRLRRC
jgi:hypothetical protein